MASHPESLLSLSRRRWLGGSVLALAGLGLACTRQSASAGAIAAVGPPAMVPILSVDNSGKVRKLVSVPKVAKTMAEWKKLLPPKSFYVAREGGTERPFSGEYNDLHAKGIFRCICCGTALFDSATKFDSGTGWPSFWQPLPDAMGTSTDFKAIYPRTEYHCARCEGHQGHVFDDGPRPTGLRYCMNSVSLRFIPFA